MLLTRLALAGSLLVITILTPYSLRPTDGKSVRSANVGPAATSTPGARVSGIDLSRDDLSKNLYSIVLNKFVPIDGVILISNKTIEVPLEDIPEQFSEGLRRDFMEHKQPGNTVVGPFDVYAEVKLVSIDEEKESLSRLFQRYPKAFGVVFVSSIAVTPTELAVFVNYRKRAGEMTNLFLLSKYKEAVLPTSTALIF